MIEPWRILIGTLPYAPRDAKAMRVLRARLELFARGKDPAGAAAIGAATRRHARRELARLGIVEDVSAGASLTAAALAAGVSRATLHRWRTPGSPGYEPQFAAALAAALATTIRAAERLLWECANQAPSDPRFQASLLFLLKTRCGYRETGAPNGLDCDDSDNRKTDPPAHATAPEASKR